MPHPICQVSRGHIRGFGNVKNMLNRAQVYLQNLKCIVLAIMLGGVFALIKVLFYRNLRERLKYMFTYFRNVLQFAGTGSFCGFSYVDRENDECVKRAGIKFSLPILIAAINVMGDML